MTPTATETLSIRLTSLDFDAALYVVTDCDDIPGTCLGASDEVGNASEEVQLPLDSGTTYYIIVDGHGDGTNDAGDLTLEIGPP